MNAEATLTKIRRTLLVVSAGTFFMTVVELVFVGHWNENIQYLPFALSAFGLAAIAFAYTRPGRASLTFLRWTMIAVAACSLIGFYEHIYNNYTFWLEIQPNTTTSELINATFTGGIPVLAPGILLLGAVLGWLAVYNEPSK
jgi:hypothetical protein